jgi:hypothetical protein
MAAPACVLLIPAPAEILSIRSPLFIVAPEQVRIVGRRRPQLPAGRAS